MFSKPFCDHYDTNYILVSWLFLRGLALIYFAAFTSMAVQIEGLVGANGILPIASKLDLIERFYPQQYFWRMPTVFWFNASDTMLVSVCYIGIVAASLLLLNIFPRAMLIICYGLYLSVVEAGQDFTHFQWDVFLLETGFLAIFLSWGSGIVVLLFRWLLMRFMFMGGLVKIASGDPSWANLTALNFHYETQPLPTPVAYYAYQLPEWFHKICVAGVFFIELVVPFFIFLPRRFRIFACYAFIFLQGTIILTGNYTFFNLLTILLCLFLLDDQDISKIFSYRLIAKVKQNTPTPSSIATLCAGLWASLVLLICASQVWLYHVNLPMIEPLKSLLRTTSTLSLVNNYGPFSVMTTQRKEIIVQGSNDAQHWSSYEFKYKPGNLTHGLGWNIPHQPRLDWQMWFAALDNSQQKSWVDKFLIRLLEGSPQVLALLGNNPFPENPPAYIRALRYRYSFTSSQQHNENEKIWQRQLEGFYRPVLRH
jgi:hypothetical protein